MQSNQNCLKRQALCFAVFSFLLLFPASSLVYGQTTAFTSQGKLNIFGNPATGTYDMQFKLFDALANGNPIGDTIINLTVVVANGVFSVELDFGAGAFDGSPRFLEICVHPAGYPNPYTALAPRQPINSTPYAVRSANASAADGLSAAYAGCVTNTHIDTLDGAKSPAMSPAIKS